MNQARGGSAERRSAFAWPVRDRRTAVLFALLLLLFCCYDLNVLRLELRGTSWQWCDFFGLWSAARFAQEQGAARPYDPDALRRFQEALLPGFAWFFPFRYPPSALLLLRPLAPLPYAIAYAAWVGGTFGLLLAASVRGRRWGLTGAVVLLAPSTAVNATYGQWGFLAAALVLGAFRLAGARPVLAGVLLGVLGCKPQLALLVPVALAAASLWRTTAAAAATALGLAVLSAALFGADAWSAFLHSGAALPQFFAGGMTPEYPLMPTVAANLVRMGAGAGPALAGQAVAALGAAAMVWACFRRGTGPLAVAALLVGTLLATPYAFRYDMVLATAAVLLLVQDVAARDGCLGAAEIVLAMLTLLLPITLIPRDGTLPVAPVVLALLLAAITRRALR